MKDEDTYELADRAIARQGLSVLKARLITEVCRAVSTREKVKVPRDADQLAREMMKHGEYLESSVVKRHLRDLRKKNLVVMEMVGQRGRYWPTTDGAECVGFSCTTREQVAP